MQSTRHWRFVLVLHEDVLQILLAVHVVVFCYDCVVVSLVEVGILVSVEEGVVVGPVQVYSFHSTVSHPMTYRGGFVQSEGLTLIVVPSLFL